MTPLSTYPGALDDLPTNKTDDEEQGPADHTVLENSQSASIKAIQATLGINPQGAAATVKARLDTVDEALLAIPEGGGDLPWFNPMDYGAVGDGVLHSLGERYGSLAAAQVDYPFATSLTTEDIEWAAITAAKLDAKEAASGDDFTYARGGGAIVLPPHKVFKFGKKLDFDNYRGIALFGYGNAGTAAAAPRLTWAGGAGSGTALSTRSTNGLWASGFHLTYDNGAYDGDLWDFGTTGADPVNFVVERVALGVASIASARTLLRFANAIIGRVSDCHFLGGVNQLEIAGNYAVGVTIEDPTFNGSTGHQLWFNTSGIVESFRVIRPVHEPAGAGGYCGDITMTQGAALELRIEEPWFGDHSGACGPSGAVITLEGSGIKIDGYRNSGLGEGLGTHVKVVGTNNQRWRIAGQFTGGNGVEFVSGTTQHVDLSEAALASSPGDDKIINPANVQKVRGRPFGELTQSQTRELTQFLQSVGPSLSEYGDTSTAGILMGSGLAPTGVHQCVIMEIDGTLVLIPRSTDADKRIALRDGNNSTRVEVGDNGLGFNGRSPAKPSVAADATDLASAIALVNDLKAKLRDVSGGLGLLA